MSDTGRLYRAWRDQSGPLLGYLTRRLPDGDEARDLLSESMLRLVRNIGEIDEGKERAWLFTTARRLLVDRHRERFRFLRPTEDEADRTPSAIESLPDESAPSFLDRLIAREATECLERQWKRMEPALGDLLEMKYLGGLTDAECAQVLDLTPGHLRVRLHRSRKALETLYREHCEGGNPT
ncbi:MAG: RNA polymerase sigma factor [Spirochaetes bacterium]|nr:RNA polymerase sigma factor [Spirochaetota bacterium]